MAIDRECLTSVIFDNFQEQLIRHSILVEIRHGRISMERQRCFVYHAIRGIYPTV